MILRHYSDEKLKRELAAIVSKHSTSPFKLFFFGSRVSNPDVDDRADIDVGFLGEEPLPLRAKANIKEEIEDIRTLYKIDFIDFFGVSDRFKSVALRKIEYIN